MSCLIERDGTATPAARGPARASSAGIRFTGLGVTLGTGKQRVVALQGVDLPVGEGEFVFIVGPSTWRRR